MCKYLVSCDCVSTRKKKGVPDRNDPFWPAPALFFVGADDIAESCATNGLWLAVSPPEEVDLVQGPVREGSEEHPLGFVPYYRLDRVGELECR